MANAGDKSIPGYANPKCYAKALCECSAKVDDEHYVSDNALTKITRGKRTIFVQNLGFQERNVLEEKGIARLTSRVLCKFHNRSLSPHDQEFGKMVVALDAMDETAGDPNAKMEHFFVDGGLIERCFLKTLCGGLFSGNFLVPQEDSMRGMEPPRDWLDIFYKGASFQPGCGLYLLPFESDSRETTKYQLEIGSVISADDKICGLRMRLYGFDFVLLMCARQKDVKTEFDTALFRPECQLIVGCMKQLIFRWNGGKQSDPLVVHWVGQRWVKEE